MAVGGVRERDLHVLASAIGLSAIGDGVALVALGLQAKNMSGEGMGSGVAIAAMFICLWAPVVLLSGHVGLLVDRVETRSLLVATSIAQAVVAVGLAVIGSLWLLLALAALLGSGIAVAQTAEFALVPVVAGERELQRANGLVETARSLGLALGPLSGSLLVTAGGTAAAMLVDAASFVVVGLAALSLAVRRSFHTHVEGERRRARDGIAFLLGDRVVGLMVAVVFVSLLFMSASIPADLVYVEDVLGVEDIGIGVVLSAWMLGMLVGANVVARRVALPALAGAALVGVTVQGLGKFVAPFWLAFGFMLVTYFVGGIGHGLKNVASRTLIHVRIAPERHGRAFAAWNGVRNAAELGALAVGGIVVGLLGPRPTLWLAGGLAALAGVAGLGILAAWRGRLPAPEAEAGTGTIGSP
jgi:MFS family permease